MIATYLFIILVFSFLFLVKSKKTPKCTVPWGPRGHWLFGHSRLPMQDLTPTLFKFSQSCGPIFQFSIVPWMALLDQSKASIMINDVHLVKKMLQRKDFSNRDLSQSAETLVLNPFKSGIVSQDMSRTFKSLHRFTLANLSSMGFGRSSMEAKVLKEAKFLVEALLAKNGAPLRTGQLFTVAISNVISNIIFSQRTDIGEYSELHERLKKSFLAKLYLKLTPLYVLFPKMVNYYQTQELKDMIISTKMVKDYIKESLEDHERTLDPDDPRDFIDNVILEKRKNPNAAHLSLDNIQQTVYDIFFAGTDTTSTALLWSIAWMVHHPEIRAKLEEEIEETLGFDGTPSYSMIHQFNYLQAFIDEVLRASSMADFGLPHRVTEDSVNFEGFVITNKQTVMMNLWGCLHDPSVWPNPEKFQPERFLDDDGNYKRNENMIQFGLGARHCLGEKLARLELFIFIITLLQHVDFQLAKGCTCHPQLERCPPPNMYGIKPGLREPGTFEVTYQPKI